VVRHGIAEYPDDSPEYSDRPGRNKNGPGPISALDRPTSERDQARGRFATDVIAMIETAWKAGSYDRLIVSAPPKMLGTLRHDMTPMLKAALHAELHKDLLKTPIAEMPEHFAAVMTP